MLSLKLVSYSFISEFDLYTIFSTDILSLFKINEICKENIHHD